MGGGDTIFVTKNIKTDMFFDGKLGKMGFSGAFRLLAEKCTIVGSPAKCAQTTSARPATESHDIHRKRKNKNNIYRKKK